MTKPRFLHLIPDEKFIDGAHELFEAAAPGSHEYLLLAQGNALRFIRTFSPPRVDPMTQLDRRLLESLAGYDAVFIHQLGTAARLVVDNAPVETKFVWLGWGVDYYHLLCKPDELLLPATKALLSSMHRHGLSVEKIAVFRAGLVKACKCLFAPRLAARYVARRRHIGPGRPGEAELLRRVTIFAPVLEDEYAAIVRRVPGFHASFARWNYASLVSTPQPASLCVDARNILLGNSATPTNNHMDAFHFLKGVVDDERKIICPLSYGKRAYGDMVESAGKNVFGTRFTALREFIPADEYTNILRTCSIAAMNHIRQQALGNILMMLWLGARVFLNYQSPVVGALKSLGIVIFDIRSLPDFLRQQQQQVSDDDLADIRGRLTRRYGHEALVTLTRNLLTQCSSPQSVDTMHRYTERIDRSRGSQ